MKRFMILFFVLLTILGTIYCDKINPYYDEYYPLIKNRIEMWNKIYDIGYSLKDFTTDISDIECDGLLEQDLSLFKLYKDFPTNLEKVTILECKQNKIIDIFDGYEVNISITFKVEDLEGDYQQKGNYIIGIKKKDNKPLLYRWDYIDDETNEI